MLFPEGSCSHFTKPRGRELKNIFNDVCLSSIFERNNIAVGCWSRLLKGTCLIFFFFISIWLQAILASRSRVFQKMLYQAPSPQQQKKAKDPPQRETNKLRLFLKRSSEPLLNLQNAAQQVKDNENRLKKSSHFI